MVSDDLDKEFYSYDDICPECGALYELEGPGRNCYFAEGCGLVREKDEEEVYYNEYEDEQEDEESYRDEG